MTRQWRNIAKAEYYISTSRFYKHRNMTILLLYALGMVWALFGAPIMIREFIQLRLPWAQAQIMFQGLMPGLMRMMILFLWIIFFIMPLTAALQEIKIGQWEILLSHNVRTRDILTGTFLGKVPVNGIIGLVLTPILLAPFMLAFEVTLIGQLAIYAVIIITALSTIWLSNFVTAMIQSKLGDSPRGNDIAKGLAMILAVVFVLPSYGIVMFAPLMAEVMSISLVALLPSTWSADLISWLAISFTTLTLNPTQLAYFGNILLLDLWTNAILMGSFCILLVTLGLVTADRVFSIKAGARTETITSVEYENIFYRGIRKISPGSFGTLVLITLKDFFRKTENLGKIAYASVLAIAGPFALYLFSGGDIKFEWIFPLIMAFMGVLGIYPFAGTAFLESKDQLWIIQSTPSGASRFIKAKLALAGLIAPLLAIVPCVIMTILMELTLSDLVVLVILSYAVILCGSMVSIGLTARNPTYEGSKSPEMAGIMMFAMLITMLSLESFMLLDMFFGIIFHVDIYVLLETLFGTVGMRIIIMLIGPLCLFPIGVIMMWSGARVLTRPYT